MKNLKLVFMLTLSLLIIEQVQAQDSQKGDYKFRILTTDKKITYGFLTAINDSEMTLKKYRNSSSFTKNKEFAISAENIKTIKIRKKGKVWKSAVVGSGIGFLTGGLIALATGDDPKGNFIAFTKEQKIAIFGPPLAGLGFGIGALIGSQSVIIKLNKDQNKFRDERKRLENYVLKD